MNQKDNSSINILGDYIKDTTLLVSRDLNISQHDAKHIVLDIIKKKSDSGEVIDPIVEYQGKDQNGDRVLKKRKLTKYFDGAKSGILVPSGTVYVGHDVELSIHAENTENRVKLRSACKKEGFLAEQLGDMQTAGLKEKFQKAYKLGNNAITGLFDNAYNIHYCPSSHFTLTSVTASVTSIGNSIGESMTAGNRLYTKPEIVINHIISFTTNNDFDKIKSVVSKYNLYIPSVDDCMYLILKSTRFYWKSTEKDKEIRETLELLKPEERCAFVYVNDLYHFREFNPVLVRDLFSMLMTIDDSVDNPNEIMKSIPEDIEILAKSICYDDMLVHAKNEEVVSFREDTFLATRKKLAGVSLNIKTVLGKVDDLISVFFMTNNLPINIADIKQMIRKCTILSDTDSTCSTYQEWVQWYFRRTLPQFTAEEIGLSGIVLLFSSRTLEHSLQLFSKRMNIKGRYLKLLAMKNEFYWKTMIFMNKTKHYFADTAIREGNVYAKTKLELKGSNLIDSKLPSSIKSKSDNYFLVVNETLTSGKLINVHEMLRNIADIEREIIRKFKILDSEIMKEETILDHASYKGGKLGSAYYHLMLWNEVFGAKYGVVEATPVVTVKIKTTMTSKKEIQSAINGIEDKDIRDKFLAFVTKYPKDRLETLRLPKEMISNGIPKELEHMMEIRNSIEELCSTFYLILESLGYYKKPGLLLSDYY